MNHWLSAMIALPLLGAFSQAALPRKWFAGAGFVWVSLAASACSGFIALWLVFSLSPETPGPQYREALSWIGAYSITYDIALDGLSAPIVLLLALIFPILIAYEWNRRAGTQGMHALLLVLQSSLLGAVCAQDLFLSFFFWSLSALPVYFLIGIWGGEGRESAAFRSLVVGAIGNSTLFAALLIVYYSVEPRSFLLESLSKADLSAKQLSFLGGGVSVSWLAFALVGIGLALRAPLWPLHGWFTQVALEAPPSVFVGVCSGAVPVALYLLARISLSLFPEAVEGASPAIVAIGSASLLLGGITAVVQRGLRMLLAFICVSEVGIVLIGIGARSEVALSGALYHLLALGIGLAGFGLFSGLVAERTGLGAFLNEKGEGNFGGVASLAPGMAVVMGVVVASLLGFPGFGGFIGHSLLMIGSFPGFPLAAVSAGFAFVLEAYYLFTVYRWVFLGSPGPAIKAFNDLSARERMFLFPLVVSLVVLGVYPKPLLDLIRPTVSGLLSP